MLKPRRDRETTYLHWRSHVDPKREKHREPTGSYLSAVAIVSIIGRANLTFLKVTGEVAQIRRSEFLSTKIALNKEKSGKPVTSKNQHDMSDSDHRDTSLEYKQEPQHGQAQREGVSTFGPRYGMEDTTSALESFDMGRMGEAAPWRRVTSE